jgi:hypothetical protein
MSTEQNRSSLLQQCRTAVVALLVSLASLAQNSYLIAREFRGPFAAAVEGRATETAAGGEEEEHLETDRDSFTPATTLVGHGRTMIEGSYSFIDNRDASDSHSYPELLTRVGLTDWFELRLGWNHEAGGGGAVSGSEVGGAEETAEFETESKVLYGFKVAVSEQENWLPRSALIVHATTPTSGANTATQFVTGYVAGWTLPNGWDLDSSLRYAAANEEGDHFNQWAPSIVLKVPLGEHWNTHVEYFGVYSDGRENDVNPQYISPGLHYLICPDCEIGVRTGWGLNDDAANFFSNVGLGIRF